MYLRRPNWPAVICPPWPINLHASSSPEVWVSLAPASLGSWGSFTETTVSSCQISSNPRMRSWPRVHLCLRMCWTSNVCRFKVYTTTIAIISMNAAGNCCESENRLVGSLLCIVIGCGGEQCASGSQVRNNLVEKSRFLSFLSSRVNIEGLHNVIELSKQCRNHVKMSKIS